MEMADTRAGADVIGFTRFRAGSPTVGVPIEIAAITKHDGFRWVRHKEYYDRQLNAAIFED